MSYTIIENFLPVAVQNMIEEHFIYNSNWSYSSSTSGNSENFIDKQNENIKECSQLINLSYMYRHKYEGTIQNEFRNPETFDLTKIILHFLELASGCTVTKLFKIKTKMNLMDKSFEGKFHPPHTDHTLQGVFSLIYYIKDSDGPTRFFNKSDTDPMPWKDLVEIGQVEPKKGRAVLFPSNIMHTGTCPVEHDNRLSINYVFEADDLKINFQHQNNLLVEHIHA